MRFSEPTSSTSGGPVHTPAQSPRVELDHIFIVVQPGAQSEIAAPRSAGFIVASRVAKHEGQGTASVAAFFENAYLELIWVDSSVSVDQEHTETAARFKRAAAWRQKGQSPFGFGLRRLPGDTATLPVPVKLETAAWLEPGTAYELPLQTADSLAADFFVMPASRSLLASISRLRERTPELLQHAAGTRRITLVRAYGPVQQQPAAFQALRPATADGYRA